jgi:hypothetical protein
MLNIDIKNNNEHNLLLLNLCSSTETNSGFYINILEHLVSNFTIDVNINSKLDVTENIHDFSSQLSAPIYLVRHDDNNDDDRKIFQKTLSLVFSSPTFDIKKKIFGMTVFFFSTSVINNVPLLLSILGIDIDSDYQLIISGEETQEFELIQNEMSNSFYDDDEESCTYKINNYHNFTEEDSNSFHEYINNFKRNNYYYRYQYRKFPHIQLYISDLYVLTMLFQKKFLEFNKDCDENMRNYFEMLIKLPEELKIMIIEYSIIGKCDTLTIDLKNIKQSRRRLHDMFYDNILLKQVNK